MIGFMQGRLCDQVGGKIQAFPWDHWRDEFPAAQKIDFKQMEWTLDHDRLRENPLNTRSGRQEIQGLSQRFDVRVNSLTGDFFMQAPFFKSEGLQRRALLDELKLVLESCAELGIRFTVIPLVDNGRLESDRHADVLREGLNEMIPILKSKNMKIVFESDFTPLKLSAFIESLPARFFGINYDIGNSAALGFDPVEEFQAYGSRVDNVHVKDRVLGGTTVPLGTGNADFKKVFQQLAKLNYRGDFILQTARAQNRDHSERLSVYRDMVNHWTAEFGIAS